MKRDPANKLTMRRPFHRRKLLKLLGATAILMGAGHANRQAKGGPKRSSTAARPDSAPACVVRPEQMEGPYFIDEKLRRADIRTDPSNGAVKDGERLDLTLRVSRIDGHAGTPLAGTVVDIWQCDARGVYSGFEDINGLFDTRGQHFLRGFQKTDDQGVVRFVTIYPGWYQGRTVHLHFKIRTGAEPGFEYTSQLYFDDAVSDRVFTRGAYAGRPRRDVRNEQGWIYRKGGGDLMLALIEQPRGYSGTFDVGLRMS
ncbi:MAG: intradiol ring-cleavage dioxygenase [Gammaproteobacteria bacterium]|nr:intradiol ring-cleavage dioxygenase [Gammaproteobacteria bacterium]